MYAREKGWELMKKIKWLECDSVDLGKKFQYRMDIDAEEFKGRAGLPWLIMAANVNLSINELLASHGRRMGMSGRGLGLAASLDLL